MEVMPLKKPRPSNFKLHSINYSKIVDVQLWGVSITYSSQNVTKFSLIIQFKRWTTFDKTISRRIKDMNVEAGWKLKLIFFFYENISWTVALNTNEVRYSKLSRTYLLFCLTQVLTWRRCDNLRLCRDKCEPSCV